MKVQFRTISLVVSGLLALLSIWAIATYGLRVGIDFRGGELLELRFVDSTSTQEVRTALEAGERESVIPHATAAETTTNTFLIRTATDDQAQIDGLRTYLNDTVGEWQEIRFERVGPTVGKDLTRKAFLGVTLASLAIILYIAWAFRRVPPPTNSWQFGVTAIVALLHDLLITVGAFALLGHFLGYEVDALFITALLTVMGFSVHDTIVTYDRIRENLLQHPGAPFEPLVNASIAQTVVRSFNTSLTLIFVLLALLLIGGSSIRPFIVALLVGVSVGTYSSIFVASQLLVVWQSLRPRRTAPTR
ncbi:protein translocase subunit SecF [Candidatus Berkelbacteria bacterium]|nr:protein translocase subunit SecF [Candidatus Berkelbacteria bacterium]